MEPSRLKCLAVLALLLLAGCGETKEGGEEKMVGSIPLINLEMSMPISTLLSKSPVTLVLDCLEPAGLCFYEYKNRATAENLPSVQVGKLRIDRVMGVNVTQDKRLGDSLQSVRLTLGVPPLSDSAHEDNRQFIYGLVERIQGSGWEAYYAPFEPRIPAAEAGKVSRIDMDVDRALSRAWFNPGYRMDLQKWKSVENFYDWYFYKEGIYLHLAVWRNDSAEEPDKKGTYLKTIEFQSTESQWRYSFEREEDQKRWKELLPAYLEHEHELRLEAERKARSLGLLIDEKYQDPPIAGVASLRGEAH